jgi:CheY-like chemotaxis protein
MAVIPGEYAMIAVRDNGAGMSKEILEHIFEPFFTTKDLGKGTGLGLATVYGIVRQNNGYIDVRSEPGEGTTFKIYLPRCENKTDEPTSEVKSRRISGGEETILLVEDSRPLLELGKRMLENLGYTVLPASTPRQAIDLVGRFGGDIQLLITDVVLPEMSGRELMARLSAARPNMRCLYMSGYTSGVIARQGVLEEGILFIQKPFSRADFAAKIRQAMN